MFGDDNIETMVNLHGKDMMLDSNTASAGKENEERTPTYCRYGDDGRGYRQIKLINEG
jgi:hypothetical protein